MSILKQAEELSLTPDNLKSLKTIIRHDVIDTFRHLFTSITGLHDGLKETLGMLHSLDLLADDDTSNTKSKIQDLMHMSGELLKAEDVKQEDIDLYDAPKNAQKINIKDLDLHSLNITLSNTKELYYSYIDENVGIYRLIVTNLSNLNSDEIESHAKLTSEIVKGLAESMNEILDPLDHFKVSYDEITDEIEQGTKLYKKFEFLNDIIS